MNDTEVNCEIEFNFKGKTHDTIEQFVQEMLAQGWKMHGQIVVWLENGIRFGQPLIRQVFTIDDKTFYTSAELQEYLNSRAKAQPAAERPGASTGVQVADDKDEDKGLPSPEDTDLPKVDAPEETQEAPSEPEKAD